MKLFPKPTPNELVFGLIYYLLQLFAIPGILVVVNLMLRSPVSEAMLNFICYAINFVAVLIIFRRYLKDNFQILLGSPWSVLRGAALGFLLYWVGSYLFSLLTLFVAPDFSNINDAAIAQMADSHYGLMTVSTVFLVPIVEECFYRGLMFRCMYDRTPLGAYVFSMVLFSLVHVIGYVTLTDFGTLLLCFIQYLPAGFALAWSYRKTGSLFAPVLIHMAVNQTGMLLMR